MMTDRRIERIEKEQKRIRRCNNISLLFNLIKLFVSTCIYIIGFIFLVYVFISFLDIGLIHNGDSANQFSWNFFKVFFNM